MRQNFIFLVEEKIGYKFVNKKLIEQAFTRKTYSQENGGENNERLEFVGDKSLDVVVIMAMLKRFSSIQNDGSFHTEYNEGQFTEIKKDLVEKKALSKSMDRLGFNQYLIMGKGDIGQNIQNQPSVKEDLFEAIVGAVTIDCNWNYSVLYEVVDKMIGFDEYFSKNEPNDFNYIGWVNDYSLKTTLYPPAVFNIWNEERKKFVCDAWMFVNGEKKVFRGFGDSKQEAANEAAKSAYEHIVSNLPKLNPVIELIGEPDLEKSISQVNELKQRSFIEEPKEEEQHSYTSDGLDYWNIALYADGKEYMNSSIGKKNNARRKNFYEYLLDLVKKYDK